MNKKIWLIIFLIFIIIGVSFGLYYAKGYIADEYTNVKNIIIVDSQSPGLLNDKKIIHKKLDKYKYFDFPIIHLESPWGKNSIDWIFINLDFSNFKKIFKAPKVLICKNLLTYKILKKYINNNKLQHHLIYTGFTSLDRYNPTIYKDEMSFLHISGKSPHKGTELLLNIWQTHPEWPLLTIVCRGDCLISCKKCLVPQNSNIRILTKILDEKYLKLLMNSHMVHICPSKIEGFGHCLNEGKSTGAIIFYPQSPPLNELFKDGYDGLSIKCDIIWENYKGNNIFKIPISYITPKGLNNTMKRYLHMNSTMRRRLSDNARISYLTNDEKFEKLLIDAIKNFNLQFTKYYKDDIRFKNNDYALVTITVNDIYTPGALALIRSQRINSPSKLPFICLYNNLNNTSIKQLTIAGFRLVKIKSFNKKNSISKYLNTEGKYKHTFDKLWLWTLPYKKILYLDSDMLINKPIIHIFSLHQKGILAIKDKPLFNTGLMVLEPSKQDFNKMVKSIAIFKDVKGPNWGDQEFLSFFWKLHFHPLPNIYNCLKANSNLLHKCKTSFTLHWNREKKPWTDDPNWWIKYISIGRGIKEKSTIKFKKIIKDIHIKKKINENIHRENLILFHDILTDCNILHWAQAGTALGLIREKNIITGDSDVDIGIWSREFGKFIDICLPKLEAHGFLIGRSNPLSFIRKNHYVDLDIVGKGLPCMDGGAWWPAKCDKFIDKLTPFHTIYALQRKFTVPNIKYIIFLYGKNWKIPIKCHGTDCK